MGLVGSCGFNFFPVNDHRMNLMEGIEMAVDHGLGGEVCVQKQTEISIGCVRLYTVV